MERVIEPRMVPQDGLETPVLGEVKALMLAILLLWPNASTGHPNTKVTIIRPVRGVNLRRKDVLLHQPPMPAGSEEQG